MDPEVCGALDVQEWAQAKEGGESAEGLCASRGRSAITTRGRKDQTDETDGDPTVRFPGSGRRGCHFLDGRILCRLVGLRITLVLRLRGQLVQSGGGQCQGTAQLEKKPGQFIRFYPVQVP